MKSINSSNVDLSQKLAIVTGGGQGLGRSFAKGLASACATVAVIARSTDQLEDTVSEISAAGGNAIAYPGDVTNRPEVEQIIKDIGTKFGPTDLLINNAGSGNPLGPLWEVDPDEWWGNMKVNLQGPMLLSRFVLPEMIKRRQGRIINICSGAGLIGIPNFSPYVVSKTALIRFTENLALEIHKYGIRVFALGPGTVRTAMAEVGLSAEGQKWLPWFSKIFEEERDVSPDLAVNLVLQLAAGKYDELSGRYLDVHQDLEALENSIDNILREELYTLRLKE